MIRQNIGCGPNVFPGWTNTDREDQSDFINHMRRATPGDGWPAWQANLANQLRAGSECEFIQKDLRERWPSCPDDSVDAIYLGQMIEHINRQFEVKPFLYRCFRALKPGCVVRITTPDIFALLTAFNEGTLQQFEHDQPAFYKDALPEDQLCYLMYGASGPNCTWDHYEGHMHLYSPLSLRTVLEGVGFKTVYECAENVSHHPAMTGFNDLGMSYGFAMEAVKP